MLHTAHRPEDLSDKFTKPRCKTRLTFYLPYIQQELCSIFLLRLITSLFPPNRLLFESTRRAENDRCSWTRAVKDARTPLRFPLAWDKKNCNNFFGRGSPSSVSTSHDWHLLPALLPVIRGRERLQLAGSVVCYCLPILPRLRAYLTARWKQTEKR